MWHAATLRKTQTPLKAKGLKVSLKVSICSVLKTAISLKKYEPISRKYLLCIASKNSCGFRLSENKIKNNIRVV